MSGQCPSVYPGPHPATYLGLNSAECRNPWCRHYVPGPTNRPAWDLPLEQMPEAIRGEVAALRERVDAAQTFGDRVLARARLKEFVAATVPGDRRG